MTRSNQAPATICTVTVEASAAPAAGGAPDRPRSIARIVFHSPLPPGELAPPLIETVRLFLARQARAGRCRGESRAGSGDGSRPGLY